MISILKNAYIDKLDHILHESNNTYHRTIKTKSIDVKSNTCLDFDVENNDENLKWVTMQKYQKYEIVFAKGYPPTWSEEVFMI